MLFKSIFPITHLKVFVDENGNFGNPVSIIIDEKFEINQKQRQEICLQSKLSEVVFINNIKGCNISIFSPTSEVEFAGHAVIGAAWFLDKLNNTQIKSIECLGHKILVRHEDSIIWVKADLQTMPLWNFKKFSSPLEVENLKLSETKNLKHCYVWSWQDRAKHLVRARTFASDWLIKEDEANGSGSMSLAAKLKHKIRINHGKGSVIYVNYIDEKWTEVGGAVIEN